MPTWKRRAGIAGAVMAAALSGVVALTWQSRTGPADAGLVRDDADLMTALQERSVVRYHRSLLKNFDIDYRVVTARHLGDIDTAAVAMFRELGRTSRSRSGRGLLLLIDAASNRVRLEVGYPLEGSFPDAFVDYVERQQMVRFFERGRVADGIVATTELIVARAQGNSDVMATASEPWSASSGGAGAAGDARLGMGPAPAKPSTGVQDWPGTSPGDTVDAYVQAMAAHDDNARLPIYTPETREMLAHWVITPAQMDNEVRAHRRCAPGTTLISADHRRAVIRYPASKRHCAPFFLRRGDERWLLDLITMQRAIRFGATNAWHFDQRESHPYGFAFTDWRFDDRGYPVVPGNG